MKYKFKCYRCSRILQLFVGKVRNKRRKTVTIGGVDELSRPHYLYTVRLIGIENDEVINFSSESDMEIGSKDFIICTYVTLNTSKDLRSVGRHVAAEYLEKISKLHSENHGLFWEQKHSNKIYVYSTIRRINKSNPTKTLFHDVK